MHQGCFVWTPTPPLAGWRTPRPGPVRVCVCSSFLAGSGWPASRARSGAPHPFLWPFCLSALLSPLRAGVASFLVLCLPSPPPFALFFFFLLFSVPVLRVPPLSLVFFGFRPRVPWALALCVVCFVGPPLLGSPCALASFVLPAWPLAAASWLPSPPFCVSRFVLPLPGAVCFFYFFLFSSCPRPRCLWLSLGSGPGCPGAWRCALCFFFASRKMSLISAL